MFRIHKMDLPRLSAGSWRVVATLLLVVGVTYFVSGHALANSASALQDDDDGPGWIRTDVVLPFTDVAINECQPDLEVVFLVGEARFIIKTRTDNNGITHIKEHIIITASGTGAVTGAHYELRDHQTTWISRGDPFPFSFIDRRVSRLKGYGVPDMVLRYYTLLSFDVDGNETGNVFDFRVDCH